MAIYQSKGVTFWNDELENEWLVACRKKKSILILDETGEGNSFKICIEF